MVSGGITVTGMIDGENGYSNAVVQLFRRYAPTQAEPTPALPTGTLTYTFSTGVLSGATASFNGWSQQIPAVTDGTKLFVTQAAISSQSATCDIATSEWSTPVEYVADGAPGEDSAEKEWIYKHSVNTNVTIPTTSQNVDGYVPSGWNDHPVGVDSTSIYEYACYRIKPKGSGTRTWSKWMGDKGGGTGDKPILWSHWGRNGTDGDGTEYVFIRTKTKEAPLISDFEDNNPDSSPESIYNNANYMDSNHGLHDEDEFLPVAYVTSGTIEANNVAQGNNGTGIPAGTSGKFGECTDSPKGVDENWPYEWAMKRSKGTPDATGFRTWNVYEGEMSLWANWSENGAPGTQYQRRYKTTNSSTPPNVANDNPSTWSEVPTPISSNQKYRYVSQRISNDGGNVWGPWSSAVLDAYCPEDGRSISIKGQALDVIAWGGHLPVSGMQDGDTYLMNNEDADDYNVYESGIWEGYASSIGDGFIVNGYLWMKINSQASASQPRWQNMGLIQGPPGDDAVLHYLESNPDCVNFRSNAVGNFTPSSVNVKCKIKKVVGDTETEISSGSDGLYLYYQKVGAPDHPYAYTSAGVTVYASEALAASNTITSIKFILSTATRYRDITSTNTVKEIIVPVICDGRRGVVGATGKMFYSMGVYDSTVIYSKTELSIPLIFFDNGATSPSSGERGAYFYLSADTNVESSTHYAPAASDAQGNTYPYKSGIWTEASDFGLVITQGIFAEFAKLGKAIMSGDYMFSMNGRIIPVSGDPIEKIGGDTYTYGGQTRPAYTWFKGDTAENPTKPYFEPNWWVDLLTGKMSAARGNFVVESDGDVMVDGHITAKSISTSFFNLYGKYVYEGGQYILLSHVKPFTVGTQTVYNKVGQNYVAVDISRVTNFMVRGMEVDLPDYNDELIGRHYTFFNPVLAPAANDDTVLTIVGSDGMSGGTDQNFFGVGVEIKYGTNPVPSDHEMPPGEPLQVWSFSPVDVIGFINGSIEVMAVPHPSADTEVGWNVLAIGTNCYLLQEGSIV